MLGDAPALRGSRSIDLLVLDARRMPETVFDQALAHAAELNSLHAFRRGLLIWSEPQIKGVVRALRAGFNDILDDGIRPGTLLRHLAAAFPHDDQRRARLHPLVAAVRLFLQAESAPTPSPPRAVTAALRLQAEQQAVATARLADARERLNAREAALQQRERVLQESSLRLQHDLRRAEQACTAIERAAALDAELTTRERALQQATHALTAGHPPARGPFTPAGLVRRGENDELTRREQALAARERLLRDYEAMLNQQPGPALS